MNSYYNNIKDLLINNEITKKVKEYSINKSDLETKYEVGKLLSEAGKHYGGCIIKKYSVRLMSEVNKKYEYKTLCKMRQFYNKFLNFSTMSRSLSYSHYLEFLSIDDINKIKYYINLCSNNNLSVRQLRERIKSKEYERLPEDAKNKLISKEKIDIKDSIPEPIIIKVNNNIDKNNIKEKALQRIILEDISNFMKQLGNGYSFIDSEYKIKTGNNYHYIDILLFNYIYNCFVVVELKVTDLNSRHIGQVMEYVNYIDKNVKTIYQNKTIGIILVKRNNTFIVEYSSNESIIARTYELN